MVGVSIAAVVFVVIAFLTGDESLIAIMLAIGLSVGAITGWISWNGAVQTARLYNTRFGTLFTTEQVFWAGDAVRDTIIKMGYKNQVDVDVKGVK